MFSIFLIKKNVEIFQKKKNDKKLKVEKVEKKSKNIIDKLGKTIKY